jgi:hypothetical protein
MSTPNISDLINIPANIASLVAAHADATSAIAEHAENHKQERYLARRKMHVERMMTEDAQKGSKQ